MKSYRANIIFSDAFEIPELPRGQKLQFIFLNSWDDPRYIGLNTIEIFNDSGKRPQVEYVILFHQASRLFFFYSFDDLLGSYHFCLLVEQRKEFWLMNRENGKLNSVYLLIATYIVEI